MGNDLSYMAGDFAEPVIPKDKKYLFKYFKTDIQTIFLKYYMTYKTTSGFTNATGRKCTRQFLSKQRRKIEIVEAAHQKAKQEFDIELLWKIENGKYKVKR
jgi:hypothetical protein